MYKPHYKALYERQKQANKLVVQAFIILVVLLALVLIGSFIRAEQELISPLPAHAQTSISTERVEIVELLPSPLPMSKRLKECIRNHPDVLPLIKEYFPNEWNEMAELLCRESSFNTQAVNPSSGACGLFQALPCTKMGCELTDTHCQFDWGSNYIKKRYGTATEALFFHSKFNWY